MRIYFSGGGGLTDTPEVLIPQRKPHVMLTFHNIHQRQSATIDRLKVYLKRKKKKVDYSCCQRCGEKLRECECHAAE